MSDDLKWRKMQLKNLVVMALADGSLGENEVNLMADRCQELELSEDDLRAALESGLGDDAHLDLPSDPQQRRSLLMDLLRMMAADGVLAEGEKRVFALAAAKMSISGSEVDSIIDEVTGS